MLVVHLLEMPPHICVEVFKAHPTGRRLRDRPRTCWRDLISYLALDGLRIPQEEVEDITGENDVLATLFNPLLP